MKRTLSLKRERLVELGTDELASVHGGQAPTLQVANCLGTISVSCPAATCNCCTASASC